MICPKFMKCGDHLYACGIFSSLFISHLSLYVTKKMKCGEELGELLQSLNGPLLQQDFCACVCYPYLLPERTYLPLNTYGLQISLLCNAVSLVLVPTLCWDVGRIKRRQQRRYDQPFYYVCVCVHLGEQSTNLIQCSLAISQHCTTAFFCFCYGTLTTDIRKNVYGQCFSGSCVSYTYAVQENVCITYVTPRV